MRKFKIANRFLTDQSLECISLNPGYSTKHQNICLNHLHLPPICRKPLICYAVNASQMRKSFSYPTRSIVFGLMDWELEGVIGFDIRL